MESATPDLFTFIIFTKDTHITSPKLLLTGVQERVGRICFKRS